MAKVDVLIRGWTNADSLKEGEEENNACTTSLIQDGDIIAVVDPGVMENKAVLIDALASKELSIEDITHVFVTHSHIDHYRNAGMFPAETPVVEYWGIWSGNKVDDWQEGFSENIKIIKTPGHNRDALTFLVNTDKGQVAICGDVFWKENHPAKDPYADNSEVLKESRKKVLELADYIIPGHADIYKVRK